MDFGIIPGTSALGQPRLGSIYDEIGDPDAGYAETGPYHCEDCIHKTAPDEPFCIHPRVIGAPAMQSRLVLIDGRPAAKINMEHGCCKFVRPPEGHVEEAEHGEAADE